MEGILGFYETKQNIYMTDGPWEWGREAFGFSGPCDGWHGTISHSFMVGIFGMQEKLPSHSYNLKNCNNRKHNIIYNCVVDFIWMMGNLMGPQFNILHSQCLWLCSVPLWVMYGVSGGTGACFQSLTLFRTQHELRPVHSQGHPIGSPHPGKLPILPPCSHWLLMLTS